MKRSLGILALATSMSFVAFTSPAAHAATTCPPVIDIGDYYTGGTLDLDAYLAALAAATAACSAMPTTGADISEFVALGTGLVSIGAVGVVATRRRRQPTSFA